MQYDDYDGLYLGIAKGIGSGDGKGGMVPCNFTGQCLQEIL